VNQGYETLQANRFRYASIVSGLMKDFIYGKACGKENPKSFRAADPGVTRKEKTSGPVLLPRHHLPPRHPTLCDEKKGRHMQVWSVNGKRGKSFEPVV